MCHLRAICVQVTPQVAIFIVILIEGRLLRRCSLAKLILRLLLLIRVKSRHDIINIIGIRRAFSSWLLLRRLGLEEVVWSSCIGLHLLLLLGRRCLEIEKIADDLLLLRLLRRLRHIARLLPVHARSERILTDAGHLMIDDTWLLLVHEVEIGCTRRLLVRVLILLWKRHFTVSEWIRHRRSSLPPFISCLTTPEVALKNAEIIIKLFQNAQEQTT